MATSLRTPAPSAAAVRLRVRQAAGFGGGARVGRTAGRCSLLVSAVAFPAQRGAGAPQPKPQVSSA